MSLRRWLLLFVWLLFALDTALLAPSTQPSPLRMAWRLTAFDWPEPALICLWYATGVVVFLHVSLLMGEAREARPHPLYLLFASIVLGSLVLLPYYALRPQGALRARPPAWPASRLIRVVLIAELVGFSLYGILAGNVRVLWQECTTRRFSHFLLIDFVILFGLLVLLATGRLSPSPRTSTCL